ncbi:glycosyltransferase family 2 protein [Lachnospiraceae bacterium 46-15]
MGEVKVSVIVPVYNTEAYLEQCLSGILGQTLEEIEVICVDDGSSDGSVEQIKRMGREDGRLHLLTQKNRGGGAARNAGMRQAKGKYLVFLDSDDCFHPEMLEKMYLRCEETDAQICVCKAKCYHEDLGFETPEPAAMREELLPEGGVFNWKDMPEAIFDAFHNWPWNKMFLRSFVEEKGLKFQEIRRTNDLFFTCAALAEAEKIATVREEFVYYRVGLAGSCQTTNGEAPLDFFEAFLALKEYLEAKGIFEQVKRSFVNHALDGCMANLNSQEGGRAHEELYHKFKEGLLKQLAIEGQPEEYFHEYNRRMYAFYKVLQNGDYQDFLRYRIEDLKAERDRCLVSDYHEKMELARGLQGYRQQKHDLLACREYRLGAKLLYVPLKIRDVIRKK